MSKNTDPNGFDRATQRFATSVSARFSRRDSLSRISAFAAGIFGVSFAPSVVSPTAFAAEESGCTHETAEPDACDKDSGVKCGFHNSKDCSKYSGCTGCTTDSDGCPKGTSKGSEWSSCCACKEDSSKGTTIKYWDCCGTVDSSCSSCSVSSCATSNSRCGGSWCGGTAGSPECTYVEDTGNSCTP